MAKYLILNADDYGLCHSANQAVQELFLNGRLKSATVMMPCNGAKEAVQFSIDNPQYAIGVHLTLTNEWAHYHWKPLTDGKSLVSDKGWMWETSKEVEQNAKYSEIEAEIRAQIDYAHSLGMKPSHIDNHMGSLYGHYTGRFSLLKLSLRVCGDYGYSYRMYSKADRRVLPTGFPYFAFAASTLISSHWAKKYNVIIPDYLLFPEWNSKMRESYEVYRNTILKIWTNIPDGVTETFVHPSIESDEIKGITARWKDRVWEYKLLNDPETHKYLKDHGIEMISYRELISMRSK